MDVRLAAQPRDEIFDRLLAALAPETVADGSGRLLEGAAQRRPAPGDLHDVEALARPYELGVHRPDRLHREGRLRHLGRHLGLVGLPLRRTREEADVPEAVPGRGVGVVLLGELPEEAHVARAREDLA